MFDTDFFDLSLLPSSKIAGVAPAPDHESFSIGLEVSAINTSERWGHALRVTDR
jgi:hypothetical protein